jgi:hypothetical protein
MPLAYDELRQLAASLYAPPRFPHQSETTALVNEAYLSLVDVRR